MADSRWGAKDQTISARSAVAVTPHDTNELASNTRGLYIGGTGDVAVMMEDGTTVTFVSVLAGSILPVRCAKVLSTGTTATAIVALF